MNTTYRTARFEGHTQFGLMALMEFVTICAILFSFSSAIGVTTSILLAIVTLALATKHGLLAIILLGAAFLAADVSIKSHDGNALERQLLVVLISVLLCAWFRFRRHRCQCEL